MDYNTLETEPYVPSIQEYNNLLEYVHKHGGQHATRDTLILLLTWGRGLRSCEALQLREWQVTPTAIHVPRYKSKTGQNINYVITTDFYQKIKAYIDDHKKEIASREGYLFVGSKGHIMTSSNWNWTLRHKYLDKVFNQDRRILTEKGHTFVKYTAYCGRRFYFNYIDDILGDRYSLSDKCLLTGHKSPMTLHTFYLRKHQTGKAQRMIQEVGLPQPLNI